MKDFAAIDFETANSERTSVCSVGVVVVRNGEIVDSFYSLIQPEPNYYTYFCSRVYSAGAQLLYLFLFTGARTLPGRYRLCSGFSEGLGADRSADRRTSTGSTQQIV